MFSFARPCLPLRLWHASTRFSMPVQAGCRSELGDNHPDTVTAIDTLSQLLSDLGKLEEALPLKRESLAVRAALSVSHCSLPALSPLLLLNLRTSLRSRRRDP